MALQRISEQTAGTVRLKGWHVMAVNAFLVAASIVLALAGIEVFIALLKIRPDGEKKQMFVSSAHFGHCYSSDPTRYWPLSLLERQEDRAILGEFLPASEVDQLVADTPFCILYDVDKRRQGFSPARKTQVALVGDSFCFGEGIRDEDTLGNLLGSRYENVNFRNLGWPGTDITHVSSVVTRALREMPDLGSIVYIFNLNDIPDAYNPMVRQTRIHDLENVRWDSLTAPGKGLKPILENTVLFRLAKKAWVLRRETAQTTRDYLDIYVNPARNEGFQEIKRQLREMRDAAGSSDTGLVVVVYPLLYKDLIGGYPFRRIHDLLRKECLDLGIRFVDAYPPFDGFRNLKQFTVHEIDLHPNGRANRLVVDYLALGDKLGLRNFRRRQHRD